MHSEITKRMCKCTVFLCIAWTMVSCSKGNEAGKNNDSEVVNLESPTGIVIAVEAPKEQTKAERLEEKCRVLAVGTELKRGEKSSFHALNDLCKEIRELPKEEALQLFDKWIDMAVEQPLTNANYSSRYTALEQSFHVVLFAFLSSLNMRESPFEHWNKVFCFYAKCTDEITAMEEHLKGRDCRQYSSSYRYLRSLRECLKNWIHTIRSIFPTELSKGLTEEQKVDILRRFKEVEKFTVPPPHAPFSKK